MRLDELTALGIHTTLRGTKYPHTICPLSLKAELVSVLIYPRQKKPHSNLHLVQVCSAKY